MSKLSHSPINSEQPLERCDHCGRTIRVEDMNEDGICMDCVNREEEFRRDEMNDDVDFYWREW